MTNVYAWQMRDGDFKNTQLRVYFLLTDHYFVIGTHWPDEEPSWLTRSFVDAKDAQDFAILHTSTLEKAGDTMEFFPVVYMSVDQSRELEGFVDSDVHSHYIDALYETTLANGLTWD